MITVCVPNEEARAGLEPVPDETRVLVWDGSADPPDGIGDTEFLLGAYVDDGVDTARLLATTPRLRVIQLLSAGVDHWLAHVPDGATLCNARGVHGSSTAELAVAGILSLVRRLPFFLAEQAAGRWSHQSTQSIDGKRLLVLGAGDISRRVVAALEVFGATSTFVGHSARDGVRGIDELPGLLSDADIVVVGLPLTNETRHLIDAAFLAALPDGAIIANIARGAIIDTDALLAELTSGRLHAFLDVTDPEPLPPDHPLWHAPNVVITPHVGGGTQGWQRLGYRLVREQVVRYVAGEPLHNVVADY